MLAWVLRKVFGSKHEREIKRLWPIVAQINEIEAGYQKLSDEDLQAKTPEFRQRVQDGETLDDILPEAFAAVKNACRRLVGTEMPVTGQTFVWGDVPFDVQLLGSSWLHHGGIAEMQTGEGKTLVATLPLYLNALAGVNCHLVTHSDYLARRDSQWVGSVLQWLGLTIGCIQSNMRSEERRTQYECDVTYGTSSEFGFDYLRDMGMASDPAEMVQRGHHYAIVDEIDSILVDEAKTPLIISGPVSVESFEYGGVKAGVQNLVRKQNHLCSELAAKAKATLADDDASQDEKSLAILDLVKVQMAMPTHKQLLRLLEETDIRREVERQEMQAHSDQNRGMLQELKDTLYFTIDERAGDADLSELGRRTMSPKDTDMFVLPDLAGEFADIDVRTDLSESEKHKLKEERQAHFDQRSETIHSVSQLLRAYCCFERDRHYIIEDDKVVIVDDRTGAPMYGRRYSDGLHQALEAKEGVKIEQETQTLATITIQNYFRMYDKLAGMTGTAETEAAEFKDIYKLDVLVIPTNMPCVRANDNDIIYKTKNEKYRAIINEVKDCHKRGQPVLLGTISVDVSEKLSRLLRRDKVPHTVLNAKHHQSEAEIVARAGQPGAVTVATNMAGRGTDIRLGAGVVEAGGLHVIGSERHDSRRIDRQLRGRCARQGDPGSSRFYISLEDDLMRLFGGDRITRMMEKFGFEEGEELSHPWLNRTIENAQRKVEAHHFAMRKRTLQYDDVMNKQREVVYGRRKEALQSDEPGELLMGYIDEAAFEHLQMAAQDEREMGSPIDKEMVLNWLRHAFPVVGFTIDELATEPGSYDPEALSGALMKRIRPAYATKIKGESPEAVSYLERQTMLNAVDRLWQEHLYAMDQLRQGVYLHSHAQRDPVVEYKKEAYTMFGDLMERITDEIAANTFRSATSLQSFQRMLANMPQQEVHDLFGQFETSGGGQAEGGDGEEPGAPPKVLPYTREQPKVGRNDPCPCGSGKKFKKCHGRSV